jgi:hypothetical protein
VEEQLLHQQEHPLLVLLAVLLVVLLLGTQHQTFQEQHLLHLVKVMLAVEWEHLETMVALAQVAVVQDQRVLMVKLTEALEEQVDQVLLHLLLAHL